MYSSQGLSPHLSEVTEILKYKKYIVYFYFFNFIKRELYCKLYKSGFSR